MTPEGITIDTSFPQPDGKKDYKVDIFGLGENEWGYLRKSVDELSTNKNLRENVIIQLTRLSAVGGNMDLSPRLRLQVALEATTQSAKGVAKQLSVHHSAIQQSARDTFAAIIYLQGIRNNEFFSEKVIERVNKLTKIDNELCNAAQIADLPPMRKAFKQLPHVNALLRYYLKYKTVNELLKDCKVSFTNDQLGSVKRFLFGKTIDDSIYGISTLARRYVLGNWLYIDRDKDSTVSKAAVLVLKTDYSHLPLRFRTRIRKMRLSLIERMNTEYKSMRNAVTEDMTLFPDNFDGQFPTVVEAYSRFADAGYCPMSIREQAGLAVAGLPQTERSKQIRPDEYYSKALRLNYDGFLMNFLEIVLMQPILSTRDSTLEVFNLHPQQILREAKQKTLMIPKERQTVPIPRVRPLKQGYPVIPELPVDSDNGKTTVTAARALILKRMSVLREKGEISGTKLETRILPVVDLPPVAQSLLDSPSLWINVHGIDFVPRPVVEELIIRRNGNEKKQNSFTVYIADQRDAIKKMWNIIPVSVWGKQKGQYWDKNFVTALFTNIKLHLNISNPLINKIAYTFSDEFDIQKLKKIFYMSNIEAEKVLLKHHYLSPLK